MFPWAAPKTERYDWGVFERFTDRARRVLTLAQEEARLLNHSFIGTEHILLGVISEGDGLGAEALRSLGVSFDVVRDKVEEIVGASLSTPSDPTPFTPRAKKVLELSLQKHSNSITAISAPSIFSWDSYREGEGVGGDRAGEPRGGPGPGAPGGGQGHVGRTGVTRWRTSG